MKPGLLSKIMDRKFTIFILILLLLVAGGVFWWWSASDYLFEDGRVNSKYYIVKASSGGQIIENEKEGFQITVPSDWIVHKNFGVMSVSSQDTRFDEKGRLVFQSIRDGACVIGIEIIKYKESDPDSVSYLDYIKILIETIKAGEYKEDTPKNEVILINNKEGLLVTYIKEEKIRNITLEVPINNTTLYSFDSGIIFNEKCIDEFYKIIETISINK